jgi:hypothetical protein
MTPVIFEGAEDILFRFALSMYSTCACHTQHHVSVVVLAQVNFNFFNHHRSFC